MQDDFNSKFSKLNNHFFPLLEKKEKRWQQRVNLHYTLRNHGAIF